MKIPSFVQLTCQQVTELVTDYMQGALSVEERARFEQHLHACTWCMTYFKQMRRTVEWTSQLSARNPTDSRATLLQLFRRCRREGP